MTFQPLCPHIIEDIICKCVEIFNCNGINLQILKELKILWESKIRAKLFNSNNEHVANEFNKNYIQRNNNEATFNRETIPITLSEQLQIASGVFELFQNIHQSDGTDDTSDDEDVNSEDSDTSDEINEMKEFDDSDINDSSEEPLNSDDDNSDEEPGLFDTENIIVCQFHKIMRNKNRWKFILKDGIMYLDGTDYIFKKAIGDAEW